MSGIAEHEAELRAELEQARAELEELQRVARIGTWTWDVAADRAEWSDEMYRIAGIEPGTPIDRATYSALYHPEDRERAQEVVGTALRTGRPYTVSYRIIGRDGVVRWIEGRGVVELDDDGAAVRLFGTAQDITETKTAQERAHVLRGEQRARVEAESAAQRLQFLAEASALLAGSLDYETTLRNVARLAVPAIADWCAVDLAVGAGIERVAVEHTDPTKLELVRRLEAEYPTDHSRPQGVGHVIRTGRTELMAEIPDELLVESAQDERHLELIRQLGLRSFLIVPLLARERVLGAFTLVQAESGRRFSDSDVGFLEDIARRAAVAIDNARLVQDLEDVQKRLEEQSLELEAQTEQLETQAVRQQELLRQVSDERRLLREIFEHAPAVMALYTGPDHVISMINPQWEQSVGRTDAVGRTFREVFPELAASRLLEIMDRVYESGEPFADPELEAPLARGDGRDAGPTYWHIVWLPLPQRADGTRDVMVHAVETTAQVRARRQVQSLTDAGLAVHAADDLAEALSLITSHARSIIGAEQAVTTMEAERAGEPPLHAVSRTGAAGTDADTPAPADARLAVPLVARDGSTIGTIELTDSEAGRFTADDEAVLVQLAQMAAVAIENTQLYERALDANRAKSDFLATMSHELRTPLNAMIGYAELLEMGVPEPIPAASRGQVERIRLAAQHLLQLIEEILTFSRVEAGRENVIADRVSLHELTAEVRAIIEPLAEQRQLAFEVDIPDSDVVIETDPRKLRQVLLNLVGNAIKFTAEGSVAFRARADGDDLVIEVRDTGIGMSADELEQIYEPFWQAETAIHARSSGTGLGLPVSRQLVELLGGVITVDSTPGRGSTFTVRLPLHPPQA